MRQLDLSSLWTGTIASQSQSLVIFDHGDGNSVRFLTTDLEFYYREEPLTGTILGISEFDQGQPAFSLTGLKIAATDFYHWTESHDNVTALTTTFGGDDTLTGTALDDYLMSFGGHDYLMGGAGSDTLVGGDGNDHLYGQSNVGGADGADSISGGNGSDYLQGNAGNDTLDGGNGSDRINGGADNDLILGGAGNDTANGNMGDDTIQGGDGNDSLRGGQGNDVIDGGTGDDFIDGDLGADTLTGGAGHDTFQFSTNTGMGYSNIDGLITDYESGIDHLSIPFLRYIAIKDFGETTDSVAIMKYEASFPLQGGGVAPYNIPVYHKGSDTYVLWSTPATATIAFDHVLVLRGDHTITAADFI